jgi:putative endonuclease
MKTGQNSRQTKLGKLHPNLMPFYFYLARCSDNSLYAGYCVNLKDREKTHNEGKGAKYTRARRPVEIIYSEKFATRSEAMQREAAVKKLTKIEKEKLAKRDRV